MDLKEYTIEKLKRVREALIDKYIGDWNKPQSYYIHLKKLDEEIDRRIQ